LVYFSVNELSVPLVRKCTPKTANSCRTEAVGTYVNQENEDEAFTDLLHDLKHCLFIPI